MLVEAKQLGYFGHVRRRPGDRFEIESEQQFSHKWMIKVDGSVASAPAQSKKRVIAPKAVSAETHHESATGDTEVI
jgi:hypothetical protein